MIGYDLGLVFLYNEKFYINNFGMMVFGLIYINDLLYYFKLLVNNLIIGFVIVGDDKYYFNLINGGVVLIGEIIIDDKNYYFN